MTKSGMRKTLIGCAVIAITVTVSACGRKGDLEAPPTTSLQNPVIPVAHA